MESPPTASAERTQRRSERGGPAPSAAAPDAGERGRTTTAAAESDDRAATASESGDRALAESWARVVSDVMAKKALLGSVLQHATPVAVADGVLQLALAGNHFHRDLLGERTNRELINQAVQKHLPGAHRFELDADGGGAGGARNHPAVQAALNAFQGEVVAVRPRAPEEGEPQ